MSSYWLFVLVASLTVMSPGPGVVYTLTNAMHYGFKGAVPGILGIAFGAFTVATICATSLGILLATSALAFSLFKYLGAIYLLYLGVKLWRAKGVMANGNQQTVGKNARTRFIQGALLQLTNPKVVFFFLSIFPQFIHFERANWAQFVSLLVTYSGLVISIHLVYALLAHAARRWLVHSNGGRIMNKVGGVTFIGFGAALALSSQ